MTKNQKAQFVKARNDYIATKSEYKVAKDNSDNAEYAFMKRRGYENELIWTAGLDDATFERFCKEFEKECAGEIAELIAAESAFKKAENALIDISMTDLPLSAAERQKFKRRILENPKIYDEAIGLIMAMNAQTIACV